MGELTGTYTGYNDGATTYADFADSYGNVSFTGDTILQQTQYTYDAEGNVIMTADFERDYGATDTGALTSADARVSYVADWYDSEDRVIAEANYGALNSAPTRPDSPPASSDTVLVTEQSYNDSGLVSTVTDPAGNEYAATYDNANRITSPQTLYNGNQIVVGDNAPTNTYSNGELATQTDAYGNTTQYCYDGWGRLSEEIAPMGAQSMCPITYYSYDDQNELVSETDPMGHTTTYEYDNFGRQINVTYPAPGVGIQPQSLTTDYDVRGNVASQTAGQSSTTSYTYDQWNHLSSETDPDGDTTYYSYNVRGELLSVGNGTTTLESYTYDGLGRMTSATDSDNDTGHYEYDGGLLWRTINRDGQVEEYAYDNFGRVVNEYWYDNVADANIDPNHADPTNVIYYTYDRLGDVLTEGDSNSAYSFTYDALGRVTSETQTLAGLAPTITFTSSYADLVGPQRTSLLTTIGSTDDSITDYTYDGLGNVTSISQQAPSSGDTPAEELVDFNYNNDGQVTTMTRYADVAATQLVATSSYTYDGAGELTDILHSQGSTQLQNWAMTYTDGALTSRSSTTDGSTSYGYDADGQLTSETNNGNTAYAYSAAGNLTSQGSNSSYTYNSENQLTFDGTYTYTYDADGNCTSKYVADNSGNTDITVYSWDNRDRLASVTHYATAADQTGGAYDYQVNYTYDCLNQLIKRDALTPNSGTTESVDYFIYESGQVVLQFHEDNPTGDLTAGDLVHRYLWDPQQVDQLLADEQVSSLSSPSQVVWPLLNDQNSVTDLAIYEAGITAIANHRVYNAYGNLTSWMGSVGCAFGYTGKYSDPLTRLQYNTNRWYDPATCRWMSQDPLGLAAGPNVYRYAGDNPVGHTDPSGLFVITTGGSGGDPSGGNPISIQGGGGGSAGARSGGNPIMVQGATDGSSTLVEHELPGGGTIPLPNNGHILHFTDGRTIVNYGNGNQGYLVVQRYQAPRSEPGYWSLFFSLWGRNIIHPGQIEDAGWRYSSYVGYIFLSVGVGGLVAAGVGALTVGAARSLRAFTLELPAARSAAQLPAYQVVNPERAQLSAGTSAVPSV